MVILLVGITMGQSATAQLVVDEPGGQLDFDLSDNVCAICTQVDDDGDCTQLRGCTLVAAIQNANKSGNVTTITFAVPVVEGPAFIDMPTITTPVIMDGSMGPGRVHITAPASRDHPLGIRVEGNGASGTEFKNLEISGFQHAIQFNNTFNGVVEGCVIHDNSGTAVLTTGNTAAILIGGSTEAPGLPPGNIIYGNGTGISLSGGGNHLVLGNLIGFDEQGQPSGNNTGILVGIGAGEGTQIGTENEDMRNVIANGQFSGIAVSGTGFGVSEPVIGLSIRGNYIGTDVTGEQAFGNRQGIVLGRSEGILVGGSEPGEGNLISGNGDGIWLNNYANDARVVGNTIGLNINGEPLANRVDQTVSGSGVVIRAQARNNLVQNNIISGNTGDGVFITRVNDLIPSGNSIELNTIGLDAERMSAGVGNGGSGIHIVDAESNAVGLNHIGANGEYGIVVDGFEATDNHILDNRIGGLNAQLESLGNVRSGILITLGVGNVIERNDIWANGGDGIDLLGAKETTMASNTIGVVVNDTGDIDLGNLGAGIRLRGESDDNTIGGADATKGNIIAFNYKGVVIEDGQRNAILGNEIFLNQEMAIDLGNDGPTANDEGDADTGPNGLQNYPVEVSGNKQAATNMVVGEIRSMPSSTYRIEFFEDILYPEETEHLQAAFLIGSIEVETDASGVGSFTFPYEGASDFVTATATDVSGNTSELGLIRIQAESNLTSVFQDPTGDHLDSETLEPPDAPTEFTQEELDSSDIVEVRAGEDGDRLMVEVEHAGDATETPRTVRILVNGEGDPHLEGDELDLLDQFITRVFEATLIGNEVVSTSMGVVNGDGELEMTYDPDGLTFTIDRKTVRMAIDHTLITRFYLWAVLIVTYAQENPDDSLIDTVGLLDAGGDSGGNAQPIAGRQVDVSKEIIGQSTELFVDQNVTFEITVTNKGEETLEDLIVLDYASIVPRLNHSGSPLEVVDQGECEVTALLGERHEEFTCIIENLSSMSTWKTRITLRTRIEGRMYNDAMVFTSTNGAKMGSAVVEQIVGPESIEPIFLPGGEGVFKRATPLDYYLNGVRIVDDHEPDTPVLLDAVSLSSVVARLDLVESSAPDNSEPLASTEVNFLVGEGAEAHLVDTYAITLTTDADGALRAIVLPDFQAASPDPAQASLAVMHAGAAAPVVDLRTLFPTVSIAGNIAFGEHSPYVALPPGQVVLDATATDGSAREDFKFDVAQGASYVAVLHDGAAGEGEQGFALDVYRADGTSVESVVSTASEEANDVPEAFALHANYPNPFNPQTVIRYELPQRVPVRLAVYDVLGREVAVLVDGEQGAGRYEVVFRGATMPSGVYVYRLEAGTFTQTHAMLLVK